MDVARANNDRFSVSYSLWVAALLLLFMFGHDLDRIFRLGLLLVPLLLLPTVAVAVAWLLALIKNAKGRRWKRLASVVVAPFIALVAFALLRHLDITSERIRFEIGRSYYMDQVAKMPRQDGVPRSKSFDWGNTGGPAVANTFQTLVFDEADEIAKQCNGATTCLIERSQDGRHHVSVKKLAEHFYLVTEVYQ